jgi:hypothetical protein
MAVEAAAATALQQRRNRIVCDRHRMVPSPRKEQPEEVVVVVVVEAVEAEEGGEEAEEAEAEEVRLHHLYRRQVVVRALVAVGWRRGAARCAVRPVAEEVEREETAGATVGIVVGAVAVGERRPPSGPGTHSLVLVVVVVVSSLLRCLREWGVYLWGYPRWTVHWREFGGRLRGRGCF